MTSFVTLRAFPFTTTAIRSVAGGELFGVPLRGEGRESCIGTLLLQRPRACPGFADSR
jgi:hypothetical protein